MGGIKSLGRSKIVQAYARSCRRSLMMFIQVSVETLRVNPACRRQPSLSNVHSQLNKLSVIIGRNNLHSFFSSAPERKPNNFSPSGRENFPSCRILTDELVRKTGSLAYSHRRSQQTPDARRAVEQVLSLIHISMCIRDRPCAARAAALSWPVPIPTLKRS